MEKLEENLEGLCDAMEFHHHANLSVTTPEAEVSQHRIAAICIAGVMKRLIVSLIPIEHVSVCC